jgi:6-pyruvoyltetrahydropterin/6-carboxytetrahydropterin synthase
MYTVSKTFEISASHRLRLSYSSPCENLHGHNYTVTVVCAVPDNQLDENGMVADFARLKVIIVNAWDHKHLNDIFPFNTGDKNPTAENMAHTAFVMLEGRGFPVVQVSVFEAGGSQAVYSPDGIGQ